MEKSESVNKRKNNFQNWVKIMEFEKELAVANLATVAKTGKISERFADQKSC